MDRLGPTLLIIALIALAYVLMMLGWRARRRRQSALALPNRAPAALGPAEAYAEGWYVATTLANEPLERVAVHGLGFRASASVGVHPEGLVFSVRGLQPILIADDALRGAGRATWAIDRVVEKDGLVLIGWMLGTTPVDSYFRIPSAEAAASIVSALQNRLATVSSEGLTS